MYSPQYASAWSPLTNSQIGKDDHLRSALWNISHPIKVSGNQYDVDPFYMTENAPTQFRATDAARQLNSEKHYINPPVYASESDTRFMSIGDTNATFTYVDEKGFEHLGRDVTMYPEIEAKINAANMPMYDAINDPGNYPPYIQHKPLINDPAEYLNYETVFTHNRPTKSTKSANIATNKMLMKHAVKMDNIVKGDRAAPDGSIDTLDLTIRSPTDDYTLFRPIHEQYTTSVMSQTSSQTSVINGDATTIQTSTQTINDNGKITSQKSAIRCKGLNMNRCVPIEFENKLPNTSNLAKAEAFRSGVSDVFTPEAFAPSLGVYSPTYEASGEGYAPPPTSTSSEGVAETYTPEAFTYKDPNDAAMAPAAIESYLDTLKARATAVCFYLQHNKSYQKWAENWKFLYENLHKKNRLLFERLDESDADIAYVVNKGEEVKFRIRDEKRFIPINIYQYVLYHEMAHMSTHLLQHPPFFFDLLSIISLAAFEMGFIDLTRLSTSYYKTNGAMILCRASLKGEIIKACKLLADANPKSKAYFNGIAAYAEKKGSD